MRRYIDELQLLHAMRLAVVATDAAGTVTFVNEAATELCDAPTEELLGGNLLELLGAATGTAPPFRLDSVLAGHTWRGDLTVRRPRGDTFLAAVSATPVRDAEDVVVGTVVVAEDMTEIRAAEAKAASSAERLRLAHEAAQLGSWHWDMAQETVVWDEQLEAIYGMPPGGFGSTFDAWEATLHPDDHDRVMGIVQEAMAARAPYVLSNRIFWPDGTVRWIEAHGKVTTDEAGNPTGTIGCVRDVTDRVTLQEREKAAAARALLLQEVTAGLVRAGTLDEVEAVLAANLGRVAEIFPAGVELKVPDDIAAVTGGEAFVVSAGDALSREDVQLLDTLASQCAIAAARANLQARTAEIAEQLQSSLAASPLPTLGQFDLAVHYAPGGDELEHVGGDWYDAVGTDSGGLAIVIGDVMGRGVRAATTMIRVRAAIRGLVTVDASPEVVLTSADEMMARDAPEEFVTAAAVLVDPGTGTVTLSNAGHVPVLLVLVTDGVVESRHHDLDVGLGRLRARAAELRDRPLQEIVDSLAAMADASLRDDVTVVAARLRRPAPRSAGLDASS